MYQRIVSMVGLVGALTACGGAPAASDTSGGPVPVSELGAATRTVPASGSAPPAMTAAPEPAAARIVHTPELVPELVTAIPTPVRVVGTIDFMYESTDEVLAVPDEVRAGAPFTVTVLTHRAGCDSAGDPVADTEVAVAGLRGRCSLPP